MFALFIFIFILFLCWGSFLNVLAYRIVHDKPFLQKRSTCNHCNSLIAWYDNLPVISWLILRAKCRVCKGKISILYPAIELLSAVLFSFLFYYFFCDQNNIIFYSSNIISFFAYFIFFSALILATRTDLEATVIPQIFSIWLVPVGFIFSYFGYLDVNLLQSFLGAAFGYLILFVVAKVFKYFTNKDGLGEGDMELLALIGSFTGYMGAWFALAIASFTGSLLGIAYILMAKKTREFKIPFGPFLSFGAIIYFFIKEYLF